MIDLHCHSTFSDGELTPKELAARGLAYGITALSLTDHDTVDGLSECESACKGLGVKFISGIELSTFAKREIHILGYNIDYQNAIFNERLLKAKQLRFQRNALLFNKLESLGINLGLDPEAVGMGRALTAKKMVALGICRTMNEAFDVYLGQKGKAYVQSKRLTPLEAVKLIKDFGGTAVLAHPKAYMQDGIINNLLSGLKQYGLSGIETYYPSHNETDIKVLRGLATKYGMINTCGSDFHYHDEQWRFSPPELDEKSKKILGI